MVRAHFGTIFDCPYCHAIKVGCEADFLFELIGDKANGKFSKQRFYSLKCNNCGGKYIVLENCLPEDKTTQKVLPVDKSHIVGYTPTGATAGYTSLAPKDVPVSHRILFPINATNPEIPAADPSMPDEFKKTYNEAASIFDQSPRASAALIRMTLEAYLKYYYDLEHSNNGKKKLFDMITLFSKDSGTPGIVRTIMHAIREEGNDDIHPDLDQLKKELSSVGQDAKKEDVLPLFQYINNVAQLIAITQKAEKSTKK